MPHIVCGNCGTLVSKKAKACPFCVTPKKQNDIYEIVVQSVEPEVVEAEGEASRAERKTTSTSLRIVS